MRACDDILGKPWTEEEKKFAVAQRLASVPLARIAAQMSGRTIKAIQVKVAYLLLTPEQKARRLDTERRRYLARVPRRSAMTMLASPRPTEAEIEDRNRRLASAPRDLTAFIMGDPPVGFSALEQRT